MNVTGHFIPPMFIFPRKKMDRNGHLMIGAPPESIGVACESGWMNADIPSVATTFPAACAFFCSSSGSLDIGWAQ